MLIIAILVINSDKIDLKIKIVILKYNLSLILLK